MRNLPYTTSFIEAVDQRIDNYLSFVEVHSNIPNFAKKLDEEIEQGGFDVFCLHPLDALEQWIIEGENCDMDAKDVRMVVTFSQRNTTSKTYYTWSGTHFVGGFWKSS